MYTARIHSNRTAFVMFLLFALLALCYGHTLHAPWYFDDLLRIVNNPAVHLHRLSLTDLVRSFYGGGQESLTHGGFHRPVAMISFALNWFFFKDEVVGFRIVNLLIHFTATLLVYLTILRLLRTRHSHYGEEAQIQFVGLTAAILWSIHPIQIQAVTYIVQRSASMAAMFFIAAVWFYVAGRQSCLRRHVIAAFAGCGSCYFLAMLTKLNTVLLPASLLLIEILFFQDLSNRALRRRIATLTIGIGAFLAVGCIGFLWVWKGNPIDYFQRAYQGRPFTLYERLLTEPRILWYYISQIIWPLPGRFSLVHEVTISKSLLTPWTTLPSMAATAVIIALGVACARRNPFVTLSILFFFINHVVESTAIPLELLFEHRNYLPSMFLFVPVAMAFQYGIDRLSRRILLRGSLAAGVVILIVGLGWATYSRNEVWNDKKQFWEDALVKAPHAARPYQELAAYYDAQNNWRLALKLYQHSLDLYDPSPKRAQALAHTNMGIILNKMQQTELAIDHFNHALAIFPEHQIARYNLISALLSLHDYSRATVHARTLLENNPRHPYYLNAAGLVALQLGELKEAEGYLERALIQIPWDVNLLINLGTLRGELGQTNAAEPLLERAIELKPHDPTPRLCLIDLYLRTDQTAKADRHVRDLFARIPLGIVMDRIETAKGGIKLFDVGKVLPAILAYLNHAHPGEHR